ncbi:MAG: hypothetical protein Q9227_005379 [Pyrenula ochraceoflavens]
MEKNGLRRRWSRRRKFLVGLGALILVVVIALAVGLGVGLTRNNGGGSEAPSPTQPATPPGGNSTNSTTGPWWKPTVGLSWQYELQQPLNNTSSRVQVWDIDLFSNPQSTIDDIHHSGWNVICYFSAGSYENWRPDKGRFDQAELGDDLDGWPGEKWLNVRSNNVRDIMLSRLDLAASKKCDGVDPDNVDAYDNGGGGFDLDEDDAVDYLNFLAGAAHGRNLSLGLKNAGAIVPRILGKMQWSVQEQCVQYDECDDYRPFIQQGKPVFHVEYPKGDNTNNNIAVSGGKKTSLCDNQAADSFSTILKNMDLDSWIETC